MKKDKSLNSEKKNNFYKIISIIVMLLFLSSMYYVIEYGVWKLLFLIIPVAIVIKTIFFPSSKSQFLKAQAVLPSSKANGIAMGMVEIIGDLEEITPIISPYFSKKCIGYFYRIEKESKPDKDGHTTYHTIHFEQEIGDFNMLDETGFVKVLGKDLEFYNKSADRMEGGSTRHSEGYLLQDDYMMLLGYADSNEGVTEIRKQNKNVFIIAKPSEINNYNKNKPLLNSFLTTLFITILLILFILLN